MKEPCTDALFSEGVEGTGGGVGGGDGKKKKKERKKMKRKKDEGRPTIEGTVHTSCAL